MGRLPKRYAPLAFGIIQAAVTTAIAAAIAMHRKAGLDLAFVREWSVNWLTAWLTMLPVVVFIAPLIQRFVMSVFDVKDAGDSPVS